MLGSPPRQLVLIGQILLCLEEFLFEWSQVWKVELSASMTMIGQLPVAIDFVAHRSAIQQPLTCSQTKLTTKNCQLITNTKQQNELIVHWNSDINSMLQQISHKHLEHKGNPNAICSL